MPNGQNNNPVPQDEWSQYAVKDTPQEDEWAQYAITPDKKKVSSNGVKTSTKDLSVASNQQNQNSTTNGENEITSLLNKGVNEHPIVPDLKSGIKYSETGLVGSDKQSTDVVESDVSGDVVNGNLYNASSGIHKKNVEQFIGKVQDANSPERNNKNIQEGLAALQNNPNDDDAIYKLGFGNLEVGNTDAANSFFLSAVQINPNNAKALQGLGNIAFTNKDYDAANEYYSKAIQNTPETVTLEDGKQYKNTDLVTAIQGLTQSQLLSGKTDDALANANTLIADNPDNYTAWSVKSTAENELGYPEEALESLNKAQQIWIGGVPATTLNKQFDDYQKNLETRSFGEQLQPGFDELKDRAGKFIANAVDLPSYVGENVKGIEEGLANMAEGLHRLNPVGMIGAGVTPSEALNGTLQMLQGGAEAGMGAMMLTPHGYVFVQTLGAADVLTNDLASKIMMTPLQALIGETRFETSDRLIHIADLVVSLGGLHVAKMKMKGGGNTQPIESALNKLRKEEDMTGAEVKLITEVVAKEATPETFKELRSAAKEIGENATPENTGKLATLIEERKQLESESQDKIEPLKKRDEEKISKVDEEIKFILDSKDKTEPIDLPIEPENKTGVSGMGDKNPTLDSEVKAREYEEREIPIDKILPINKDGQSLEDAKINVADNLGSRTEGKILVSEIGDGTYEIGDGFHRIVEAINSGEKTIKADVRLQSKPKPKADLPIESKNVVNNLSKLKKNDLKEIIQSGYISNRIGKENVSVNANDVNVLKFAEKFKVSTDEAVSQLSKAFNIDDIDLREKLAEENGKLNDAEPEFKVETWAENSQGNPTVLGEFYTEDAARKEFNNSNERQNEHETSPHNITLFKKNADGEYDNVDVKTVEGVNESTDNILSDVSHEFGGKKYQNIRLPNGKTLNLRISQHSANRYNNTGDRNLSVVITNKNPTERFKGSEKEHPNELYFDSSHSSQDIIDAVKQRIEEIKKQEEPKSWDERYSVGKNIHGKWYVLDNSEKNDIEQTFNSKPEAESHAKKLFENGNVVEGDKGVSDNPTVEDLKQLDDVHKNLAVQYLKRHKELVQEGLRGDELNNHPDLVEIQSQMDKIENFFKENKSKNERATTNQQNQNLHNRKVEEGRFPNNETTQKTIDEKPLTPDRQSGNEASGELQPTTELPKNEGENISGDRPQPATEVKAKESKSQKAREATKDFLKKLGSAELPDGTKISGANIDTVVDAVFDAYDKALEVANNVKDAIKAAIDELKNHDLTDEQKKAIADNINKYSELSGIKKALVSDEVIKGVELDKIGDKEMMDLGRKILDTGEVNPDAIIKNIVRTGKGVLTPKEVVALITYKADLDNSLRDAYKKKTELQEKGEDTGVVSQEIIDLEARVNDFDVMAVITAQQQSMAFRLRKMMLDKDYNVVSQIEKYKANNNGYIPPEIEAKFRELGKQLDDVKVKLAEAEKKANDLEAQKSVDDIKDSVDREKKRGEITDEEIEQKVKEGIEAEINDIHSKLSPEKKRRSDKALAALDKIQKKIRANSYADVTGMTAIVDAGITTIRYAIKAGVEAVDAIELGIKKIKGALAKQGIKDWAKEDKFRKDWLEGFEGEKVETKKTEKGKISIDEDGTIKVPEKVIRDLVKRGITEIDALTDAVHAEVVKELPDATKRQVRDAITDYGKKVNKTADEIQAQINKAKHVGRLLSELEDLQNKKKKVTNPSTKAKITEQERELNRQIKALSKDLPLTDAEQQTNLATKKKRIGEGIIELKRKIATKDVSKPKPKKGIEDTELTQLNAEKIKLQEEFEAIQYENELKNRGFWKKAEDVALEVLTGIPRGLVASLDFSAILIQGAKRLATSPIQSAKALGESFRQFASEKRQEDWINNIKAQEWYPLLVASKLALTETDGKFGKREELFISNWINLIYNGIGKVATLGHKPSYNFWKAINPYKATGRAFTGYLNAVRVSGFLEGVRWLEKKGLTYESNPKDFQKWADHMNTMTGRGSLGTAETSAKWLSAIFFAPRKVIADVKLFTPYVFVYYARFPKAVRQKAVLDFAQSVTTIVAANALLWAALKDDDEEEDQFWNSNSTNFLTHRFGNTAVDMTGGIRTNIVFMSRLYSGEYTDQYGITTKLGDRYGKRINTRQDLGETFVLNKLSPMLALGNKVADERKGEEIESGDLINAAIPMWTQDVGELYKTHPTEMAAMLNALAIFGASVRNIDAYSTDRIKVSGKEVKLTKEQQHKLSELYDKKEHDYISELVNTPEYIAANEDDKMELKQMVNDAARDAAQKDLVTIYPEFSPSDVEKLIMKNKADALEALKIKIGIKTSPKKDNGDSNLPK